MPKLSKAEKLETLEFFKNIIGEKKGDNLPRLVATVSSVSQSGMSRTLKFGFCKDSNFYNVTYHIGRLLDLKETNKGLRVSGTGMDMIFNTLYNLNSAIARLEGNPSHDDNNNYIEYGYNYIVDTGYNYL